MKILNLGCGTKTNDSPDVINIDWSMYLRIKRNPVLRAIAAPFLSRERKIRLRKMPDNVLVHNLAKGIPFDDASVDAVYASHFLEHLDREVAATFLLEVKRVLKPGGIVRLVVPDLERLCREYLDHVAHCEIEPSEVVRHDQYVAALIEQSVRRQGKGTESQGGIRRVVDRLVLGDARSRGETHQWMYDRFNLGSLLTGVGFVDPTRVNHRTSALPAWERYQLDENGRGEELHAGSLYVEARTALED